MLCKIWKETETTDLVLAKKMQKLPWVTLNTSVFILFFCCLGCLLKAAGFVFCYIWIADRLVSGLIHSIVALFFFLWLKTERQQQCWSISTVISCFLLNKALTVEAFWWGGLLSWLAEITSHTASNCKKNMLSCLRVVLLRCEWNAF